MNEFEIIRRYFARQPVARGDVRVGIGDDAAVVEVPADRELVVSTDLLVAGVHFPADTAPDAIGWKALAVNLSDLAAMGAEPAWFTLNLSLPDADPDWLAGMCSGLYALAAEHDVQLIGGDTTRGPLTLGIQILGLVPRGAALTRAGARPGDRVFVSGTLGDAALGLLSRQGRLAPAPDMAPGLDARLDRPTPRLDVGRALRGLASACIDLSDGLAADLGHILEASGAGARVELERLPRSAAYRALQAQVGWDPAVSHGDDYELCFSVPPGRLDALSRRMASVGCPVTEIGVIDAGPGLRFVDESGRAYRPARAGFDHFGAVPPSPP
ncbi:MAG TPA: thiamine-phosphate kinase [Acidiferrobacterales bacterium]